MNQLGNLWRERESRDRVQGIVETAVGFPVESCNQWSLVLAFLIGLWSGCIVSLLALCVGVYLGHSL